MNWVLIVVLLGNLRYGDGSSTSTVAMQEFATKEACEVARNFIDTPQNKVKNSICLPKGGSKNGR